MTAGGLSPDALPEPISTHPSEFEPAGWLPGGHVQTFVPFLCPARAVRRPTETVIVDVAPDAAVQLSVSRPAGESRGTLLLVHGLGGSAESNYMRRTANPALDAGWTTVRMNCRNCGKTEALSRTLFNAGQSDDVGKVLEALEKRGFPKPYAVVGFSLGGNLVLLYAGTSRKDCLADAVIALSAPVDLAACSSALERPGNAIYGLYFTRELCRQVQRIRRIRQVPGPRAEWWRIRTVRNFDRLFIAPSAGYPSAEAYYAAASSGPSLPLIEVPTVVVSCVNDPVVPIDAFRPYRDARPGVLSFIHPRRGGHMGFWQRGRPRFWAADFVVRRIDRLRSGADR